MTTLKKTIARKLDTTPPMIIYLQPNGCIVFRKFHGRKRYVLNLDYIFERARGAGPAEGLFADQLQGCSKPKSAKKRQDKAA